MKALCGPALLLALVALVGCRKAPPTNPPKHSPARPEVAPVAAKDATPATKPEPARPSGPPVGVVAGQLTNDYADNQFAAKEKYDGKFVRLAFQVASIELDNGKPVLRRVLIDHSLNPDLICKLSTSDDALFKKAKAGMYIVVDGIVAGRINHDSYTGKQPKVNFTVVLTDCAIVEASGDWGSLRQKPHQ